LRSLVRPTALIVAVTLAACSGGNVVLTPAPVSVSPALVAKNVKHVFVIVQENHTFDNYFGLFPGVNGQTVENLGSATAMADDCVPDPQTGGCQRPFLITTNTMSPNYVVDAPDTNGGNNGRADQLAAINHGAMNGFLTDLEGPSATPLPANPTAAQVESHNGSIAIEGVYDCDTVPYLWYYAKNFALFDHYFQADVGQSTPGNIQLFAGQFGQTEAATGKMPLATLTSSFSYSDGLPISNDNNPPQAATAGIPAYGTPDAAQVQSYATMPVLLNPSEDSAAKAAGIVGLIPDDISLEAATTRPSNQWAWYEEGLYSSAADLSQHHTAPLYFDYINHANSPFGTSANLRDNTPSNGLISDINAGTLASTGVYWVKGGNANQYGLSPADSTLAAAKKYVGDDDHPNSGDSDHQVAETYVATLINAIAASKYWKDSVILLTWDDSGGFYDHLPPPQYGPTCPQDMTGALAGSACGDGVRLPMIVISPFAKTGVVVHDNSNAGSVSKFIETVFSLPTFASLPDEAQGVSAGLAPADANAAISDLTGALDPNKLSGKTPVNPASSAMISAPSVPPAMSCATLGITPIPSPTSLPSGFMTAGAYLHASLSGATGIVRLPDHRDDGD
jgi:phospholipase C